MSSFRVITETFGYIFIFQIVIYSYIYICNNSPINIIWNIYHFIANTLFVESWILQIKVDVTKRFPLIENIEKRCSLHRRRNDYATRRLYHSRNNRRSRSFRTKSRSSRGSRFWKSPGDPPNFSATLYVCAVTRRLASLRSGYNVVV